MATSDDYEEILYNHRTLKWSARILGTLEAACLLYMALTEFVEEVKNHSVLPLTTLIKGQYFLAVTLTVAFIGLIIAYWKEGLGGGISLIGYIVLFIGWQDFHLSFIIGMGVASLPSVLYVAYCLSVHLALGKAERDQPTNH